MFHEVRALRRETLQQEAVRDPRFVAARAGADEAANRAVVHDMGRRLEALSRLPDAELLAFDIDAFDWATIARRMEGHRTARACRAHWRHFIAPHIKRSKWTPVEENKLRLLVKENPGKTWSWYASALASGRTALQCLLHFQRSINPNLLRKRWTPEEDQTLVRAVHTHGDRHWLAVSRDVQKRNAAQCMARWDKVLDPENGRRRAGLWRCDIGRRGVGMQKRLPATGVDLDPRCIVLPYSPFPAAAKKGRWSDAERDALMHAVELCGEEWSLVRTGRRV